jgi:hypothetical protein
MRTHWSFTKRAYRSAFIAPPRRWVDESSVARGR